MGGRGAARGRVVGGGGVVGRERDEIKELAYDGPFQRRRISPAASKSKSEEEKNSQRITRTVERRGER